MAAARMQQLLQGGQPLLAFPPRSYSSSLGLQPQPRMQQLL